MSNELVAGIFRIKAVPDSQAFGISANHNEQIAVLIEFLDGPNHGKKAVWYGSFTEKTEERTIESLRYLGWSNDDLTAMEGLGSTEAEAELEEEEGQDGKLRMRVKWINRARGPAFKNALEGEQLRAFAARMKGKAVASRQKLGTPSSNNSSQRRPSGARDNAPPPHSDDDIPF